MSLMRSSFLASYAAFYQRSARGILFRRAAQQAHEDLLEWLAWLDNHPWTHRLLSSVHHRSFAEKTVGVGGVRLPYPLILAAGLVKGQGFDSEEDALNADPATLMPGWRSLPLLVGPVEFGSFTCWPRLGNPGEVIWRDMDTRSTQNRVGLKNPGAQAAAKFLAARKDSLPPIFGLNIAPTPGISHLDHLAAEVEDAFVAFTSAGVKPSWYTLNLSCPNTEDDPSLRQTEETAVKVVGAAMSTLLSSGVPLWVKLGPGLSDDQYARLLAIFVDLGVRAVVATNTLPRPTPPDPAVVAGVGGGALHEPALAAVRSLADAKQDNGYAIDIIGCGGALDGQSYRDFINAGASAVQYWSALVYRGPLAAALILKEAEGKP
jgi:dihydroorotate dehydrogenase